MRKIFEFHLSVTAAGERLSLIDHWIPQCKETRCNNHQKRLDHTADNNQTHSFVMSILCQTRIVSSGDSCPTKPKILSNYNNLNVELNLYKIIFPRRSHFLKKAVSSKLIFSKLNFPKTRNLPKITFSQKLHSLKNNIIPKISFLRKYQLLR